MLSSETKLVPSKAGVSIQASVSPSPAGFLSCHAVNCFHLVSQVPESNTGASLAAFWEEVQVLGTKSSEFGGCCTSSKA